MIINLFRENRPLIVYVFCLLYLSCGVLGQGNNNLTVSNNQKADWWRNAILYRVRPGFDIKANLHYFRAMGVSAIWLNGYNINEQKCSDTDILTSNPLEDLISLSRSYSLKILLDITSTTKDKLPSLSEYSDNIRCWLLVKGIDGISFSINRNLFKWQHLAISAKDEIYQWRSFMDNLKTLTPTVEPILIVESNASTKELMDLYGMEETNGYRSGAHLVLNSVKLYEACEYDARDYVWKIQERLIYMPMNANALWSFSGIAESLIDHSICKAPKSYYKNLLQNRHLLLLLLPGTKVLDHVHETELRKNCESLGSLSIADKKNQLPTYEQTLNEFQSLQIMQYIKQEEVLRNGDFQIQVINRSLFAIKRSLNARLNLLAIMNVSPIQQTLQLENLFKLPNQLKMLYAIDADTYNSSKGMLISSKSSVTLLPNDAILLQVSLTPFEERKLLVKTILTSLQVVLAGVLLHKLWYNKWTKIHFN